MPSLSQPSYRNPPSLTELQPNRKTLVFHGQRARVDPKTEISTKKPESLTKLMGHRTAPVLNGQRFRVNSQKGIPMGKPADFVELSDVSERMFSKNRLPRPKSADTLATHTTVRSANSTLESIYGRSQFSLPKTKKVKPRSEFDASSKRSPWRMPPEEKLRLRKDPLSSWSLPVVSSPTKGTEKKSLSPSPSKWIEPLEISNDDLFKDLSKDFIDLIRKFNQQLDKNGQSYVDNTQLEHILKFEENDLISSLTRTSSWNIISEKLIRYLACYLESAVLIGLDDGQEFLNKIDDTLQQCIDSCTDVTIQQKLNKLKTSFQKLPVKLENPDLIMTLDASRRLK